MRFGYQIAGVTILSAALLVGGHAGGEAGGAAAAGTVGAEVAASEAAADAAAARVRAVGGMGGARVALAGDGMATRLNALSGTLGDGADWAAITGLARDEAGVLAVDWKIGGRAMTHECGQIRVAGGDPAVRVDEARTIFSRAARRSAEAGRAACD